MRIINRAYSLLRAIWLTVLPGGLRKLLLTAAALSAAAATPAQTDVIQFGSANYFVSETGVVAAILVNRSGNSVIETSVEYSTDCGTAFPNIDYKPQTGTLCFGPGQDSQTFAVPILDNSSENGRRAVLLRLSNPSGATLGSESNATLTILDDELQQVPLPGLDNWTLSLCAGSAGWRVAYGSDKFVVLSSDGMVACSSDGRNWSAYSSVLAYGVEAVTFGNGLFVAVGGASSERVTRGDIFTSSDGILWTNRTSISGRTLSDVTWGNGLFVAVGCYGGEGATCAYDSDIKRWGELDSAKRYHRRSRCGLWQKPVCGGWPLGNLDIVQCC